MYILVCKLFSKENSVKARGNSYDCGAGSGNDIHRHSNHCLCHQTKKTD